MVTEYLYKRLLRKPVFSLERECIMTEDERRRVRELMSELVKLLGARDIVALALLVQSTNRFSSMGLAEKELLASQSPFWLQLTDDVRAALYRLEKKGLCKSKLLQTVTGGVKGRFYQPVLEKEVF